MYYFAIIKHMLYHAQSSDEVLKELHTTEKGLHQIYAEGRLSKYGRNTVRITQRSLGRRVLGVMGTTTSATLAVALAVSIAIGQYLAAAMIVVVVTVYALMRVFKYFALEHTLRTVEHHAIAPTFVIRDGIQAEVDSATLVPGDIVVLQRGDRIPADGRIIHAQALVVNQSHLTNVDTVVTKTAKVLHSDTPLEDRSNMVLRGSFVVSGSGKFVITATGNYTQYGQLHNSLVRAETKSLLEQKVDTVFMKIVAATFLLAAGILLGSFLAGGDAADALGYFVSALVATAPAMMPVAFGVVVAYGLRALVRKQAVMTSIRSVEAVGMSTIIVSDKTGILTHGKLSVKEVWQPAYAELSIVDACERSLTRATPDDSHDKAIHAYMKRNKVRPFSAVPAASFAFLKSVGMSGNLWYHGHELELHVKGAPEKILHLSSLTSTEHEEAHARLQQLASEGYHVVALAHTTLPKIITKLSLLPKRHKLIFDGFVALQDPVRPDARTAVAEAQQAGVRACMITGDHVETAYKFSKNLGIANAREQVFDCRRLDILTDAQLTRVIKNIRVFARATPRQKQRILRALKKSNIVMMTGDSVDDVPVLTHADVGVTIKNSSRIAREAADLILLDNKLTTAIEAIRYSRTLLGNMRRMVFFVLTIILIELMFVGGLLLLGMPVVQAVQLMWVNIIVGICLVVPLGLEPHSRNIMTRKPVSRTAPVLPKYLVVRAVVLSVMSVSVSLYVLQSISSTTSAVQLQSLVFFILVIICVVLALTARSDHTSTFVRFRTWSPLIYAGALATLFLLAISFTGLVAPLLDVVPLRAVDIFLGLLVGVALPLVVGEILKLYSRHAVRKKGESY